MVIGAVSVFPAVYIPGLNRQVFKHIGIGWEWGLSLGSVLLFVAGVEAWKALKRRFGWFAVGGVGEGSERKLGLRQGFISFSRAVSMRKSESELDRAVVLQAGGEKV